MARWQQAQQQLVKGCHHLVLGSYRNLVRRFPGVPQLWFEFGIAAGGDLEFDLAEEAFERAETLASQDVSMLVLIGQQYCRIRRLDRARACFERAVAADSASAHARLSLAAWWEREGRLDEARACVEDCLAAFPQDLQARCLKSLLLHRQGLNSEAETLLRDLVRNGSADANVKYSSRHMLGVVLDALGQYGEAMRWLVEAKSLVRQSLNIARLERDYDAADRRRRELLAGLTAADIAGWREEGPATPTPFRLALLGGHPRSGTTLLERILGVHPAVLALDESEAFVSEVWHSLAPMNAEHTLTTAALGALPLAVRANGSRRYLKNLLHERPIDPAKEVVLDKNPSLTGALHLWLRLFPNSKILIALRDPRDVLISCFFQNLELTPTNANFLSLERAAKHYADLMDTWLRLRDLGGFDWLETRYEVIVENVLNEGRRITSFLGVDWQPSQADFAQGPRTFLFAPTYSDASKPLHGRASGRWQNYSEALAPIQSRLDPYCRAFAYA
jgi:Flp pilus assembly protein TadD